MPGHEKTCLQDFRPGPTQTGLYCHRWRDCAISVVKTKVLISCVVTMQLICAFGFAYAKSRFSHDCL